VWRIGARGLMVEQLHHGYLVWPKADISLLLKDMKMVLPFFHHSRSICQKQIYSDIVCICYFFVAVLLLIDWLKHDRVVQNRSDGVFTDWIKLYRMWILEPGYRDHTVYYNNKPNSCQNITRCFDCLCYQQYCNRYSPVTDIF
jgi:hypothetical protein